MTSSENTLYIVHCVDTEGPLYESLSATSERLKQAFDIDVNLTPQSFEDMKRGIGVPESMRERVSDFLSRINYMETWSDVNEMMSELFSSEWRHKYEDDFGNGYVFSWFILDHVGFTVNPRRRSMGYHAIYDHYRDLIERSGGSQDRLYWHYHPTPFFHEAHKTSNNFSYSNEHLNVLSRRVIDYLDFPAAYRPGAHTERPDINFFLEQWVPFDYGNQGMPESESDKLQKDLSGGRYGDWRRATSEWEVYHPDFYDYQSKGDMRRYIARCLNLDSRIRPITRVEIESAFSRASDGKPTIISVTNHDEREMRTGIDWFMKTVRDVQSEKFSQVKICHANAVTAMRAYEKMERRQPAQIKFSWEGNKLVVSAVGDIWGPQPFFCFKTKGQKYIHENLDFQGENLWSYVFDEDTICRDQIEAIGVATNDKVGNTSVYRLTPDQNIENTVSRFMNADDWI